MKITEEKKSKNRYIYSFFHAMPKYIIICLWLLSKLIENKKKIITRKLIQILKL